MRKDKLKFKGIEIPQSENLKSKLNILKKLVNKILNHSTSVNPEIDSS